MTRGRKIVFALGLPLFVCAVLAGAADAFHEAIMSVGTEAQREATLAPGTVQLRWMPDRAADAVTVRPGQKRPCSANAGVPAIVRTGDTYRIPAPTLGVCLTPAGPGLVYYR